MHHISGAEIALTRESVLLLHNQFSCKIMNPGLFSFYYPNSRETGTRRLATIGIFSAFRLCLRYLSEGLKYFFEKKSPSVFDTFPKSESFLIFAKNPSVRVEYQTIL